MAGQLGSFCVVFVLVAALPWAVRAADGPAVTIPSAAPAPSVNVPAEAILLNNINDDQFDLADNTSTIVTKRLPGAPLPNGSPPPPGFFPGFGADLTDAGLDLHGILFDHFLANPTAGSRTGYASNLLGFSPALDVDLQRLLGLPGGHLHVVETIYGLKADENELLFQVAGELPGYQTAPIPNANYLSVLTYEQDLLDGRFSVEVGRTNIYRYFLLPNGLDPFNDQMSAIYAGADIAPIPFAVWGGVAKFHLSSSWYLQGGAFEDNYRLALENGYVFGDQDASGVQLLGEINYRSDFATARYPANLEVGVEYNTRNGPSNLKAAPVTYSPAMAAADYSGGAVLYAQGEQVVWRGVARGFSPPSNIAFYGSADVATNQQPFQADVIAGANFTGFVPGRPFDALGLQIHYQRLSQVEANYETTLEDFVGGSTGKQPRNGIGFEAVDSVAVTPWLTVQPLAEYFVNPDSYALPAQPRPRDGFMLGVYAAIPLGRLLGTSELPF